MRKRFWRRHRPASRQRRKFFKRLWPDSMAGRVAIILIAGLIVAKLGYWVLKERGEQMTVMQTIADSITDRVVAIVELLDETPVEGREQLLRAVSSPLFQVQCNADKPTIETDEPWFADRARTMLLPTLHSLQRPHVVFIEKNRRHHDHDHDHDRKKHETTQSELPPSHYHLIIGVSDTNCSWLVVMIPGSVFSLYWDDDRPGIFGIIFMVLLIWLVVVWLAHRETRPLRHFAGAADRLGVDVHAPPLPEKGSRELRKATQAFNRMQERLQRFIDDRTQMLAAISHDLRTVLTRLRLRIDFIDDDEQRNKAQNDLETMQTMLNATLAFARDDAANEERTSLDLAVLLQSLCDDASDAGGKASYQGPERFTFVGRPVALQRMFGNLIENAVRYGEEANVNLHTSSDEVVVTTSDRGPGIPEEMRERVFAPFFRLEPSRNRETGGTGLGLAVARSIARAHGGDVILADGSDGGLKVHVNLPHAG